MADVTGQFGQEDIQLNNAATEATLKQLLAAMKVVAAKSAKEFKNQDEFDKALKDLADKSQKAAAGGKKFEESNVRAYKRLDETADAVEDLGDASETAASRLQGMAGVLRKVAGGALAVLKATSQAATSISTMDGSISGAVDALGQLPGGLGDTIKAVYGPTAASLDRTNKAFQEASAVGANFGGNLNNLVKDSAQMGLKMEQLTGIIGKNSESLMLLGGDTATGARRLSEFGKQIRKSPVFADLNRLGFGTEAINEGFLNYTKMLAKNGRLQGQTDQQLRQGTAQYLENLDAVSKLTGKTKESLQEEENARQSEAKYRLMMAKLAPEEQAQMKKLMDAVPAEHQKGIREIIATGTARGKEAKAVMALLPEVGAEAQKVFQNIQSGAGIGDQFADDFYKLYDTQVKAFADSGLAETLGLYGDEVYNAFVVEALDVKARQKTLGEISEEIQKQKDKIKTQTEEGFVDPAKVVELQNKLNEGAMAITEKLNSIDITPLENIIETTLPQAVDKLPMILSTASDNFGKVAGAIAGMNAAAFAAELALMALAATSGAAAAAQGLKGAGKLLGKSAKATGNLAAKAAPKTAAKVAGSKGVGGAVAKGLGKAARFIPGVGAVIMGGMAAAEGVSAAMNAEDYLGLDEGEAATAGERISAGVGGIVDSLTFGLVEGEGVAKGLVDFFGAGTNTVDEYKAKIAEEKARMERSMAGENEYWGPEAAGIADSKKKIAEMEAEILKIEKANAEKKANAANDSKITTKEFDTGTLGKMGSLFADFGSGTPATLHGLEAVVTPGQMNDIVSAAIGGTMQSLVATTAQAGLSDSDAAKQVEAVAKKVTEATQNVSSEATNTKTNPMEELNNAVQELVNLTRMQTTLATKQLRATNGLSQDAFKI